MEIGRTFDRYEDGAGGPRVAAIGHALWRQRFGGNSGLVGGQISLEQHDYSVVGILASGFRMDPPADLWLPLRADESEVDHMSRVRVADLMGAGSTLETVQDAVAGTLGPFMGRYPDASAGGDACARDEQPRRNALVGSYGVWGCGCGTGRRRHGGELCAIRARHARGPGRSPARFVNTKKPYKLGVRQR